MTPKRHDVSHRHITPLSYVHSLSKISYDRFKAHQHCLQSSDTKAVSIFYDTALKTVKTSQRVCFIIKKKKNRQNSSLHRAFADVFLIVFGQQWSSMAQREKIHQWFGYHCQE